MYLIFLHALNVDSIKILLLIKFIPILTKLSGPRRETESWNFRKSQNFFLNVVILTTCNSTHLLNKFHIYCVNPCSGRNVGTHCFFPHTVKFKCFRLVLSCFKAFTHFCRKLANDAGFASKSAVLELVTN